jgi:hypothetical protein
MKPPQKFWTREEEEELRALILSAKNIWGHRDEARAHAAFNPEQGEKSEAAPEKSLDFTLTAASPQHGAMLLIGFAGIIGFMACSCAWSTITFCIEKPRIWIKCGASSLMRELRCDDNFKFYGPRSRARGPPD